MSPNRSLRLMGSEYSLNHKSLDLFVAGCSTPHCDGCFNPETWNFEQGDIYDTQYYLKLKHKIRQHDSVIDNIRIFGGEPVDSDLGELLFELHLLKKPIWVFTKYDLDQVPTYIKSYCDYIKCGRYMPELKTEKNVQYGVKLATSNQEIYKKGVDY